MRGPAPFLRAVSVAALAVLSGCVFARVSGGVTLPVDDRPRVDERRAVGGAATASFQFMYFDGAMRLQASPEVFSVALTPSFCHILGAIAQGDVAVFIPCLGADVAALHVVDRRVGFGALSPVFDPRLWFFTRPGERQGVGVVVSLPVSYEWRWGPNQPSSLAVGLQVGVSYFEIGGK